MDPDYNRDDDKLLYCVIAMGAMISLGSFMIGYFVGCV